MIESESICHEGGRHGILLFHGLCSSPAELRFIAKGLHAAGHSVHVPNMKGYSFLGSAEKLLKHPDWIKAAHRELDAMLEKYDTVSIGGLCIGAVLALQLASSRSEDISSILCLSTTLHYDGWATPWTRHLLPLAVLPILNDIGIPESHPYGVKNERLRKIIKGQMEKNGHSSAGAAALKSRDLLQATRLISKTQGDLAGVSAPVLIIHAREDECATLRSAYEVEKKVSSEYVKCVILSDSYHMISIDQEKERTLSEICNFLETIPTGQPLSAELPGGMTVAV